MENEKNRAPYLIVAFLVVIALVVMGGIWVIKEKKGENMGGEANGPFKSDNSGEISDNLKIDQGKYQAVFLSNGQVYFGKINSANKSYVELTDIYYIQVVPVLQQGQENQNENKNQNQEQQNQITLVKLGDEIHGPLDRMMINRDQVVFVEDLKDDSKVSQAIQQYKNKK